MGVAGARSPAMPATTAATGTGVMSTVYSERFKLAAQGQDPPEQRYSTMSTASRKLMIEASPGGSAVRQRFSRQGFLVKDAMQHDLYEQETGQKAPPRF